MGDITELALSEIGERYGSLRIVSPQADTAMLKSMQRYGQMSPVVCVKTAGGPELIDGFKRLRDGRRMEIATLKTHTVEFSGRACKAARHPKGSRGCRLKAPILDKRNCKTDSASNVSPALGISNYTFGSVGDHQTIATQTTGNRGQTDLDAAFLPIRFRRYQRMQHRKKSHFGAYR